MAQCGPKHGGVHRQQQQVLLAGKMARRRLGDLRGSGEMDEAVRMVDRRADEDASPFGVAPKGAVADLVDGCGQRRASRHPYAALARWFKPPQQTTGQTQFLFLHNLTDSEF